MRWRSISKFFHASMRWRSINNKIKGLYINEEWCEDPQKVKEGVQSYFENRFQTQLKLRLHLDRIQFRKITVFKEDEILHAVK